jgi:hypothetical protein
MSLTGQILPLVGVALGAIGSFLVSSLNDRARWRREQSVRWDARRLDAYGEYIHAVKLAGHRPEQVRLGQEQTERRQIHRSSVMRLCGAEAPGPSL